MTRVASPYKTGTVHDVVGKLRLGYWMIFMHEWSRTDSMDPAVWREIVQAACETDRVPVTFVVIDKHDLTVLFNSAAVPSFEQIQASIDAMLHLRWKGDQLPSETLARTGSENPLADHRERLRKLGHR